jgi:hypothetical protein
MSLPPQDLLSTSVFVQLLLLHLLDVAQAAAMSSTAAFLQC